jgi:hypothetical protein
MNNDQQPVVGYKVFDQNFVAQGTKFDVSMDYRCQDPKKKFHFCTSPTYCFTYSVFNPLNVICKVEALAEVTQVPTDSYKLYTEEIRVIERLTWRDIFTMIDEQYNHNTGHSNEGSRNSGNRNSGADNSGNRNLGTANSGDKNLGDRNSGFMNHGFRNAGDGNVGDRNSGDFNLGHRCSGESNSGYRATGAFCTEQDPELILFDKPAGMGVKRWESSRPCAIMRELKLTDWIDVSMMSEKEKKEHPEYKTTSGYLKVFSLKEAWMNLWTIITEEDKNEFTSLKNFDHDKFEQITGIKISLKK